MKHPFATLSFDALRRVYFAAMIATVLVGAGMDALSKYMPTNQPNCEAPLKVKTVAFEFASTQAQWKTLADEATPAGLEALHTQTYLDYLFLCCYSTLIAAGVVGVSRAANGGTVTRIGSLLGWGQWVAALCDGIENWGLLVNTSGPVSDTLLVVSSTFATAKFAIIAVGLVYLLVVLPKSWR